MVPQKHKTAKFICNSGFYIPVNVYPNFDHGLDEKAMRKRLKIFETQFLQRKYLSVTGEYISRN